ncbi:hypothetical protein Y032_0141g2262 [Ancylostoma ceylanicum]|uniref:Protein kinase domain-containing protein n=1 Tax=Ancylostoma ceylanicum TaxID=53326 RepID=A0A016T3W8_9BILA|nr:hypothetical protein Y032_0141g2262 [Ancylostoma ceylanicum]
MSDTGPVQLPKGTVVGRQWKIVKKLGEGGCGAVYKVQDIFNKSSFAALKAESNFVAGGTVLKLEVQALITIVNITLSGTTIWMPKWTIYFGSPQCICRNPRKMGLRFEILRRLAGRPHVPQLIHSGKKELYCYMVMTLLGDSLGSLQKKIGKVASVSTQTRVGINILFGVKQLHDIGFVHRDLKPANVAIGRPNTPDYRFLHILDFGLAREFVVIGENRKLQMRRPRPRALFRGTTRYCSINTHEKGEQGRVDDLWSVLYMLAEMRGNLPWCNLREKKDISEMKKRTQHDILLKNSPIQLVRFANHLE